MTSAAMLGEIEKLAAAGKIDITAALRLMLTAQGAMMQQQEDGRSERETLKDAVEELSNKVESVSSKVTLIHNDIEKIKKNPMTEMGRFIQDRPKLAAAVGIILFMIMNLWFISGFRRAAMIGLGFPMEIVDLLAP